MSPRKTTPATPADLEGLLAVNKNQLQRLIEADLKIATLQARVRGAPGLALVQRALKALANPVITLEDGIERKQLLEELLKCAQEMMR